MSTPICKFSCASSATRQRFEFFLSFPVAHECTGQTLKTDSVNSNTIELYLFLPFHCGYMKRGGGSDRGWWTILFKYHTHSIFNYTLQIFAIIACFVIRRTCALYASFCGGSQLRERELFLSYYLVSPEMRSNFQHMFFIHWTTSPIRIEQTNYAE